MNKIDIISKYEVENLLSSILVKNSIIISINDTGENTVISNQNKIRDVVKLWFDDVEKEVCNCKAMTYNQAIIIRNFIDKWKDKDVNIIVHCTAGISRSGAVGCCIARYLNGDDEYLLKTGKYLPNKHVYKLMSEVFDLEYTDPIFKRKLAISNKACNENLKGYGNFGLGLDDMFGGFYE